MGVDFYNCDICNEIYPDCGKYDTCESCGISWCHICIYHERNDQFMYNGQVYCSICGPRQQVRDPEDDELLEYILMKYNINKDVEIRNLKSTAQFQDEVEKYYCTTSVDDMHGELDCNMTDCDNVAMLFEMEESYDGIAYQKGRCCRDLFGEDRNQWCGNCQKKIKK